MGFRPRAGLEGIAMELFTQLFGDLLAFVYHCFDRIVIYGYLSGLSRPEQVVHFFRQVVGVPIVDKEVLSNARPTTRPGWTPSHAITGCRSNGPRRACARKTMSCPGNAAWPETTPTASTSSSRAWSRERAFASPCRNTRPRTQITGSLPTSAAASPTTISTS